MSEYLIKESELDYVVIPATFLNFHSYIESFESLFDFWESNWSHEFEKNGNPEAHWREHFRKHDIVTGVFHQGRPVSCLLYSFFDLRSHVCSKAEYFAYVSEDAVSELKKRRLNKVMTMEYLAADPQIKKNSLGVSVSRLCTALGTYLAESLQQDCTLGMPILGTSVKETVMSLGGILVQEQIKKYGYTLDLVAMPTAPRVPCRYTEVDMLAYNLWHRRKSFVHDSTVDRKVPAQAA